jgi:Ca-activated chloride channel homolog
MKHVSNFGILSLMLFTCTFNLDGQAVRGPTAGSPETSPPTGVPIFKVAVNVLFEEVRVVDEHGHPIGNLKAEDFRVFEDGAEQKITYFSHQEMPLAIALVVDNSSSISAELDEMRRGALETLALLKPDDEVAIFSFSEKPELVEGLTRNRDAVAEDLWALSPYGGTDINAAIYEGALYLGRTAHDRRRAIILVSDNEPALDHARDVREVIHAALETGTLVYSIKVGYLKHSRGFMLTHSESAFHDVEKICRESGGELIDTRSGLSVSGAMKTILAWLKQGYTIGYTPTNLRQDGAYRSIEVWLNPQSTAYRRKYTISARKGYYAPVANRDTDAAPSEN